MAERRVEAVGAVLLAGSATPRPESWRSLRRLRLPERVDGRPLPPVEVVDMRDAAHALHPRTREALERVRRGRHKAIVLLNRRGWSNFLSCRSCGRVWECPHCDVALVLHRAAGAVTCHHCGHSEPVAERCNACGSLSVARHGAGTERLEHELAEAFSADPAFPVFRLDSDTAARRGAVADLLERFDGARAGVLLGTQMVAKGHDFPDVTLGVVLDADATLRFPDFRAEERTFALVAQLAGRAGRGPGGGRVIVQTLAPDAPSIVRAAQHDAAGFLEEELSPARGPALPAVQRSHPGGLRLGRAGRGSRGGRGGGARRRLTASGLGPRPRTAVSAARPGAQPAGRQGGGSRRRRAGRGGSRRRGGRRPRAPAGPVLGGRRPPVGA